MICRFLGFYQAPGRDALLGHITQGEQCHAFVAQGGGRDGDRFICGIVTIHLDDDAETISEKQKQFATQLDTLAEQFTH